jgi:hypothetical protein
VVHGHVVQQLGDAGHTTSFSLSDTQSDGRALMS